MTAAPDTAGGPGVKPELAWLPIERLATDARYQRGVRGRRSQNLIARIVGGFRWPRFGAVLVVRAGDGWHVIDGQHRVEACRQRGDISHVPAVVLPHATVEAAAADFVAINRDRVIVTPLQIHHAMLAAGDAEALAIDRLCSETGVKICRYPVPADQLKPGETLAVGVIARLLKTEGEARARQVLGIMAGIYREQAGCLRAAFMRVVNLLLADDVPAATVARVLGSRAQEDWLEAAQGAAAEGQDSGGRLQSRLYTVLRKACTADEAAPARMARSVPGARQSDGKVRFKLALSWLRDHGFEVKRHGDPKRGWMIGADAGYTPADVIQFQRRMSSVGAA